MSNTNRYIALLRGINVGGNNIIKMDALRAEFEKMGFDEIKTYIQSGNVLFRSDVTDQLILESLIERSLAKTFQYQAKILIRSLAEMENTVSYFPVIFQDSNWKHNVIFLSSVIDFENITDRFKLKADIEQIAYAPGVLFWSARLEQLSRSMMIKLSAKKEYQEMTVRNINTTRKILELMRA